MWTKRSWGNNNDRWIISNGHLNFEIHMTIDGSHGTGYIVSPAEAGVYAEKILDQLNRSETINLRPDIPQKYPDAHMPCGDPNCPAADWGCT